MDTAVKHTCKATGNPSFESHVRRTPGLMVSKNLSLLSCISRLWLIFSCKNRFRLTSPSLEGQEIAESSFFFGSIPDQV